MYTKTKLRRMQDPDKFEQIYAELENIYEVNFAETGKKVNKKISIVAALMILGTALLLITLIQSTKGMEAINMKIPIIAIALVALSPAIIIFSSNDELNFARNFKKVILGSFIKSFGKNLLFNSETTDRKSILNSYKETGYETSPLNFYSHIDDVIEGKLTNNKHIRLSELSIKKSGGKNNITLFEGLFLETTLDKNIKADIRVVLPTMELLTLGNCTKLELDNSNFEKLFNVYTDNKIITAQLLTSEHLENLTKLRTDYGMNYDFVIHGNKLCIRLEVGSMFESASQRNKLHKEDIFVYYCILNYLVTLIDELNRMVNESSL